jgi:hypothetical protein
MLNLRHEASSIHAQSTVRLSTMCFNNRNIGNIGQTLRIGPEDDNVDEEYCKNYELAEDVIGHSAGET